MHCLKTDVSLRLERSKSSSTGRQKCGLMMKTGMWDYRPSQMLLLHLVNGSQQVKHWYVGTGSGTGSALSRSEVETIPCSATTDLLHTGRKEHLQD